MKKPEELEKPDSLEGRYYSKDYYRGYNRALREMDKYYKSELPGEEEIIKLLLVGWYRNNISLNKLGTAITARLKQVTDPQPPNQEEER